LLFVAENLNETLELISVSVWAAVDAAIRQDAKFGRRFFAFVATDRNVQEAVQW